jgi:hypothetical protein
MFQGKSLSELSELADSLTQPGTALPAWRFHGNEHMVAELSQRAMTS